MSFSNRSTRRALELVVDGAGGAPEQAVMHEHEVGIVLGGPLEQLN